MTVGQSQGLLLHDLAGRPITELNSTGGFNRGEVYADGGHLATYANSTTYFEYADGLGTTRMVATLGGLEQSACISWPYGAGLNCSASAPSPMHFTGQVHDATTGLDHFPARYYSSTWGQFLSPDGGSGQAVSDPQSWDLYAYVRGNPASLTDPSGQTYCKAGAEITGGKTPAKDCISDAAFAKLSKKGQAGYVQIAKDITVTVSGQMPPPVPLIGVAEPPKDVFDQLASAVAADHPDAFIWGFTWRAALVGSSSGLLGVPFLVPEDRVGAGEVLSDPAAVAAKAQSAVGDQTVFVSSREVAEQAMDKFLGPDEQPLPDRNTGRQVGWRSADGTRVVVGPHTDGASPHLNFRDLRTGANLHVRW